MYTPQKRLIRILLYLAAIILLASCTGDDNPPPDSLYIVDSDGSDLALILSDPVQSHWGPAWSPDGTRLAFSKFISGDERVELFLANADGSDLKQLTTNGRNNYLPAWSPTGEIISYVSQGGPETDTAEIHTIRVDGTGEMRLTDNDAFEYGTSWTSNGDKIVFGSVRNGEWQIYTMDSDGNNQLPLPIPAHGNAPDWSPDDLRIVFTSDRDGDDDIWVMNADGSQQQNLTQNDAWDDQPQWSPDGGKIAFTSDRDGTPAIYLMNSDGSGARKLAQDSTLNMAFATWSPDSSQLVFHAAVAEN